MGISLNINDTEFFFKINSLRNGGYGYSDCWYDVTVSVTNRYFNYKQSGEMLMYNEIAHLKDRFNDLVNDRIPNVTRISFTEPDIELVLHPKRRISCIDLVEPDIEFVLQPPRRLRNSVDFKDGYETDIAADFVLHLTDNRLAYTEQQYVLPLCRKEIEAMLAYLNRTIPRFEDKNKKKT